MSSAFSVQNQCFTAVKSILASRHTWNLCLPIVPTKPTYGISRDSAIIYFLQVVGSNDPSIMLRLCSSMLRRNETTTS